MKLPLLLLTSGILSASLILVNAQNVAFEQCLSSVTDLRCILPTDATYATDLLSENYRFTFQPAAIAFPTNEVQVQEAVRCANTHNIVVAPRSGGHDYEGSSQGGQDGVLLVDLSELNFVEVNTSDDTALCGSGNRLGKLYVDIWDAGQYVYPGGSCPTVGLGGLALGGGFGFLGREYGLTSDSVIEMRLVNANGDLLTVNQSENSDLYWALLGAGHNSFGIVTSFRLRLYRAAEPVTRVYVTWNSTTVDQTIDIMTSFTEIAVNLPSKTTLGVSVDSAVVSIFGLHLGPRAEAEASVAPILAAIALAPTINFMETQPAIDAHMRIAEFGPGDYRRLVEAREDPNPNYWKSSSVLYSRPLSSATARIVAELVATTPGFSFTIDYFGGPNSRVTSTSSDLTSFPHRNQLLGIQSWMSWGSRGVPGIPDCELCIASHRQVTDALIANHQEEYPGEPVPSYSNYIDREFLGGSIEPYFGESLTRLSQVKAVHDPNNLFRAPQSIPVGELPPSTGGGSSTSEGYSLDSTSVKATLMAISLVAFFNIVA